MKTNSTNRTAAFKNNTAVDSKQKLDNVFVKISDKIKFMLKLLEGNSPQEHFEKIKMLSDEISDLISSADDSAFEKCDDDTADDLTKELESFCNIIKRFANSKKSEEKEVADKYNIEKKIHKLERKLSFVNKILNGLAESTSATEDIGKINSACEEAKQIILSVESGTCTEDELDELNTYSAKFEDALKKANSFKESQKQHNVSAPEQQQQAAAHEIGFNINNFVKPDKGQQQKPVISMAGRKSAFPHEICGLTDQQIVEEVTKHFKVIEPLPSYPLYDLLNNRLLSKKMKELDSKQRPNNPYLTQVNINEYIDVPELLQKYSVAFTMPCNDKTKIIVVLFNPTPVANKSGEMYYPLHIFKATKTKSS